jgi:hypothetical protein
LVSEHLFKILNIKVLSPIFLPLQGAWSRSIIRHPNSIINATILLWGNPLCPLPDWCLPNNRGQRPQDFGFGFAKPVGGHGEQGALISNIKSIGFADISQGFANAKSFPEGINCHHASEAESLYEFYISRNICSVVSAFVLSASDRLLISKSHTRAIDLQRRTKPFRSS